MSGQKEPLLDFVRGGGGGYTQALAKRLSTTPARIKAGQ
jgi:hypothetical protein